MAIPGIRDALGLAPDSSSVASWGEVRWVHVASRIRSDRSTESPIIGRLQPGDSVRVDFAGAGWYAVFPAAATARVEKLAMGYVFGRLLKDQPPASGTTDGDG